VIYELLMFLCGGAMASGIWMLSCGYKVGFIVIVFSVAGFVTWIVSCIGREDEK